MMKPALAFPYNDPDGMMLPHITAILPDLKNHFDRAYVSSPPSTLELLRQNDLIHADSFFTVFVMMSPAQQNDIKREVEETLNIWDTHGNGQWKKKLLIKDSIADVSLQFVLIRPRDYDVIATMNLNGDYISDAIAAQVGGIGIAPGANINYETGHAIFEATHGTAPKYADLDKVNPGSVVLSGEMMLRYIGWTEAADLIVKGMEGAVAAKTVTYDFARLMDGATEVKCSEFGDAIISHMA